MAAERFRVRLAGKKFFLAPMGPPVSVTASIGVSAYCDGWTVDDVVRHADLGMYAAKHAGRNKTVSYEQLVTWSVESGGAA